MYRVSVTIEMVSEHYSNTEPDSGASHFGKRPCSVEEAPAGPGSWGGGKTSIYLDSVFFRENVDMHLCERKFLKTRSRSDLFIHFLLASPG